MANTRLGGSAEVGGLDPKAMALMSAGGMPPELQEMILQELREGLEAKQKAKAKKDNQALANIQATQDAIAHQNRVRNQCPHRKLDGQTQLAGQYLTGTGQLFLTCQGCHKEFFHPVDASLGQNAIPQALMPGQDQIGG